MALPKLLQKLFTNEGAGDKLNQDIIPEMNYLPTSGGTVNGSVTINGTTVPVSGSTETYKEGIKFGWGSEISQSRPNGLGIWAKRGDATTVMALYGEASDTDNGNTPGMFFRAGDGTNTKRMKLSATKGLTADVCELRRSAGLKELVIGGADNDGCLQLYAGTAGSFSAKKSASLFLTSTGYTSDTIAVGSFALNAMDATTGAKSLVGSPNGSLTWCNASVWCGNAKWANHTNLTIGQSFTAPSRGFVYSRGNSTSSWGALHTSVNGITILGYTGKETDTGGTAYVNAGDTVIVSKNGSVSNTSAIFVPIQ